MDCVIYMRWSSAEQGKGSSLERQREDCRRHAKENGWNVTTELIDDGISAFKGQHADTGALGKFVRDTEAGKYPDGVVLLCEKLDRLSRQEPGRVFLWMMELTEAGVLVATVDGNRCYSKGNFDMAAIIEVVVKAQLSHEESAKKSQRLAAAWAAKRKRLDSGEKFVMSRRAPAWLIVTGSPRRFEIIPERAAIIRRIFHETIAGFGKQHIAKKLNEDNIPTFGRAEAWHASYIQKILTNISVLGELQPYVKARGAKREPVGEPIKGYYPAVIDAGVHGRATASIAARSRKVAGKGRKLVNLFSGVANCNECGARMAFRGKGKKERADGSIVHEDYLVCDGYQRGRGCSNGNHYNYREWIGAALTPFFMIAFKDLEMAPNEDVQRIEIALANAVRDLNPAKKRAKSALGIAIETEHKDARAEWLELSGQVELLEKQISDWKAELQMIRSEPSAEEHLRQITELRALLDDEDEDRRHEARARVMASIHSLVMSFVFYQEPRSAFMRLKGNIDISIDLQGAEKKPRGLADHRYPYEPREEALQQDEPPQGQRGGNPLKK